MTAASQAFSPDQGGRTRARRNALILAAGQALGGAGSSILISTGGIIGYSLADDKALATLPVTAFIVGTALSTLPVNLMMRHLGRRAGYMTGALCGIFASLVSAYGVYLGNFWLFALGALLIGPYWAQVHSYRFAAAETASETFKAKAISWVLIGGVLAAVIGPQIVIWTKDLVFPPILFIGTYLGAATLCLLAFILVSFVDIPRPPPRHADDGARPLSQIMRQQRFIVSALCAAMSYAIMSLVMTATPVAMIGCGHSTEMAALGIQWHVLAMYGPSFFTGGLINRFGKEKIVAAGLILLGLAATVALTGLGLWQFWTALILLGMGWNFGFIGSTAMLTDCYNAVEQNKVQGFNDFLVFGLTATASFSSGVLLNFAGWNLVNMIVFPGVALCIAALVWHAASNRRAAPV